MGLSEILIIVIIILAFILLIMGSVMFFLLKRTIKMGVRLALVAIVLIGALVLGVFGIYLWYSMSDKPQQTVTPTKKR